MARPPEARIGVRRVLQPRLLLGRQQGAEPLRLDLEQRADEADLIELALLGHARQAARAAAAALRATRRSRAGLAHGGPRRGGASRQRRSPPRAARSGQLWPLPERQSSALARRDSAPCPRCRAQPATRLPWLPRQWIAAAADDRRPVPEGDRHAPRPRPAGAAPEPCCRRRRRHRRRSLAAARRVRGGPWRRQSERDRAASWDSPRRSAKRTSSIVRRRSQRRHARSDCFVAIARCTASTTGSSARSQRRCAHARAPGASWRRHWHSGAGSRRRSDTREPCRPSPRAPSPASRDCRPPAARRRRRSGNCRRRSRPHRASRLAPAAPRRSSTRHRASVARPGSRRPSDRRPPAPRRSRPSAAGPWRH